MKLEMYNDQFIILYWVEGEEFFDSGYGTLEKAAKRFEYLKAAVKLCSLMDLWPLN